MTKGKSLVPFINLAIGWLFGTGFLIGAVVSLFYYPLLAVPCVLLSAFILPVVSSKVHGKTGWTLDWKLRRVILVFLVGSCLVLINTAIKEKERAKKAAALRTQVAFFAANKQSILDTIRTAIDNGEFEAAITHAERYLIVNNADLEKIKKIAESRLEEQRKRQHEEAILARLKKIPVKEYQKNKNLYGELLTLSPENEEYKKKYNFYSSKLREIGREAHEEQREPREQFVKEKQDRFKKWALDHTAVTDIAFVGDNTIFVTLSASKYTNRDNVRVIAEKLAKYCALQTGVDFCTCKVFLGQKQYAKGRYER